MIKHAARVLLAAFVLVLIEPRHALTQAYTDIFIFGDSFSDTGNLFAGSAFLGGIPPDLTIRPDFCPFFPRCPYAFDRCRTANPQLIPLDDRPSQGHHFACWFDVRKGEPR